MITGKYPNLRLRRNRKTDWSRRLIEESTLSANDLILPIFLTEGKNTVQSIKNIGNIRSLLDKLDSSTNLLIHSVFLFLLSLKFG